MLLIHLWALLAGVAGQICYQPSNDQQFIIKQVANLANNQHDDDVCVGVVPELPEPPLHVLVGEVLGDVVDEERAHGPAVVGAGDGAVPLLARSVPDLGLDRLPVNLTPPPRHL